MKRPPIEHDPFTNIYAFPPGHDPDACAAEVAAHMTAREDIVWWHPMGCPYAPHVRVAPLSDAALYAEAGDLVCKRLSERPGVTLPVVEAPGAVVFHLSGQVTRQTFRVLEALRN